MLIWEKLLNIIPDSSCFGWIGMVLVNRLEWVRALLSKSRTRTSTPFTIHHVCKFLQQIITSLSELTHFIQKRESSPNKRLIMSLVGPLLSSKERPSLTLTSPTMCHISPETAPGNLKTMRSLLAKSFPSIFGDFWQEKFRQKQSDCHFW